MAPRKKQQQPTAATDSTLIQRGGVGGTAPYEAKHPDYDEAYPDWIAMRDAVAGATRVKRRGEEYLSMPSGFTAMKDKGVAAYEAYLTRAQFPEYTEPTVRGLMGVIHRVPAKIDLPPALEYMRERSTADKLTLEALHRYLTREAFITGASGFSPTWTRTAASRTSPPTRPRTF